MKLMRNIVCPISEEKVNERVTRGNAFITILFVIAGLIFSSPAFFAFLMADFYIRAFTSAKFSPVSYLSSKLVNAFNLSIKPIGKGPKIFAARLGFLMTLIIGILLILQLNSSAIVVSGILIFFASLEFALGICVGCIIYTYIVLPFYK